MTGKGTEIGTGIVIGSETVTAAIGTETGTAAGAAAGIVTEIETGGVAVAAVGTAIGEKNAHGPETEECSEGPLVPSVVAVVLVAELHQGGAGLEVH